MKRGEVWWVNFDPSIGGEIQKTRPAVIVSNDPSNKNLNRVQVVPVTKSTDKLYPCETYITVKKKSAKAMADQIMTVSKERLINKIGILSNEEMLGINHILKVQLALL